jgi:hypothetical protein
VRRKVLVAVQLLFAAAIVWFSAARIYQQWLAARSSGFGFAPRWSLIVLSCVVVLVAYAVLIETWRFMLHGWGETLSRRDAARIWFVSNLGRYLPGKVWAIGAMGVMAQRAGVRPIVATGSAIVINVVNLIAGVGVVALTGSGLLQDERFMTGGVGNRFVLVGAAVLALIVVAAPRLLPPLLRLVEQLTGRSVAIGPLPQRPIWVAAGASVVAWILYGVAFRLFAAGVTPSATGPVGGYIAVFTASYLLGYVILLAPGGLGVREAAVAAFLEQLHLTAGGPALLVAVASRLWLTVTEVLPGVVYLALGARANVSHSNAAND